MKYFRKIESGGTGMHGYETRWDGGRYRRSIHYAGAWRIVSRHGGKCEAGVRRECRYSVSSVRGASMDQERHV